MLPEPQADFDMVGAAPSNLPHVYVYSPSWCSGCKEFERSIPDQDRFTFEFFHKESEFPAWVRDRIASGQRWPAVHFQLNGAWKVAHGLTSYSEFEKLFSPSRQAAPQKLITKHAALYHGRYASQWDWPGDLRQHLNGPPHNYQAGYVSGLSDGQAIALHDQWHNTHPNAGHTHRGLFGRRG